MLGIGASAQTTVSPAALDAYMAGAKALDRKDMAAAQAAFERASALAPARQDYALAASVTRDRHVGELIQQAAAARVANDPQRADALIAQAKKIDPANELVLEHTAPNVQSGLAPASHENIHHKDFRYLPPIHVLPTADTRDLHLSGDVRQVVTQAAAAFGVKVSFDESVMPLALRFDLEHTTYAEAMPLLLRIVHAFPVALDEHTLLIAHDTQENRNKFERLVEETIYVPGGTNEQLNELTNIIKNIFDVRQAIVSPTLGAVTLRAPEATVDVINVTLNDLLEGNAEVQVELKLVTLDKTHTRNTGTQTPTSVGAFSFAAEATSLVNANQSLIQQAISSGVLTLPSTNTAAQNIIREALFLVLSGAVSDPALSGFLVTVGHGLTLLGITEAGNATLNFGLNSSDSRALDDITVRIEDRQTSILRVGSKYPVTSSTYSSGLSSAALGALAGRSVNGVSASSLAQQLLGASSASTIPIIQYEDLGITLKVTPSVLRSGLISVHVDMKIEALTGASLDNIPILTSRAFVSDITVKDGASALMLSDLSRTESAAIAGIPGLADLPGFRQSVADTLAETDSSELVLLVTPHVVKTRKNNVAGPRIAFNSSVPQDN